MSLSANAWARLVMAITASVLLFAGCLTKEVPRVGQLPSASPRLQAAATRPTASPATRPVLARPVVLNWCDAPERSTEEWIVEADPFYPPASTVFVFAHGNDALNTWTIRIEGVAVPMEWFVKNVRVVYPDKTIVLVVCNPGGYALKGTTNVVYARNDVWFYPDRFITKAEREARDAETPRTVGSIREFEHVP